MQYKFIRIRWDDASSMSDALKLKLGDNWEAISHSQDSDGVLVLARNKHKSTVEYSWQRYYQNEDY